MNYDAANMGNHDFDADWKTLPLSCSMPAFRYCSATMILETLLWSTGLFPTDSKKENLPLVLPVWALQ